MPICPNCKSELEAGAKFCMECGSPIPQNKVCPQCGTELPLAAKFCFGCGANLAGGSAPAAGLAMGDKNVVAGDVMGQKIMGNVIHNSIKDDTRSVNTCAVCGVHMTNDTGHTCPKCGKVVCEKHFDDNYLCCNACAQSLKAAEEVARRAAEEAARKAAEEARQKKIAEKKAAKAEIAAKIAEEIACRISENSSTFTDPRDGQVYKTIKIGNQVWLAENFRYKYSSLFISLLYGCSYAYDYDNNNINKYGRLYSWKAAMKCAPPGWHLPSKEEWIVLENYIKANANANPGTALKSKTGWEKCGGVPQGTDEFGFCALPAGCRDSIDGFRALGENACFWTSTEHCGDFAYYRNLRYNGKGFGEIWDDEACAYSVRLLRD